MRSASLQMPHTPVTINLHCLPLMKKKKDLNFAECIQDRKKTVTTTRYMLPLFGLILA